MRWIRTGTFSVFLIAMMTMVAVPSADALLRLGGDVRWVPLAVETMKEDGLAQEADRQLESFGVGLRVMVGFEPLSIGVKSNLARHTFADENLSYTQLDLNAHIRSRLPTARLAVYAEAGPSISLDIGDIGFNGVAGIEVDVLGWPLIDLNLGLAAQYAYIPIGIGPGERRISSGIRGMVVVGIDFRI